VLSTHPWSHLSRREHKPSRVTIEEPGNVSDQWEVFRRFFLIGCAACCVTGFGPFLESKMAVSRVVAGTLSLTSAAKKRIIMVARWHRDSCAGRSSSALLSKDNVHLRWQASIQINFVGVRQGEPMVCVDLLVASWAFCKVGKLTGYSRAECTWRPSSHRDIGLGLWSSSGHSAPLHDLYRFK
jgi:hypothetical protein